MAQDDYNWLESYLNLRDLPYSGASNGLPQSLPEMAAFPSLSEPLVSQTPTQYVPPYSQSSSQPSSYMNPRKFTRHQPVPSQYYHQGTLYRLPPVYKSFARPTTQPTAPPPQPRETVQNPLRPDPEHNTYPSSTSMMAPRSKSTAIEGPQAKRQCIRDMPTSHAPAPGSPHNLSSFALSNTPKNLLRFRADVIKPFKTTDAVKRTHYNPGTIARDVLIAAGRHPTQKPLNYHLFRLCDAFEAVDMTSDLSTFRWDLVDPDKPASLPAPAPAPAPARAASPSVTESRVDNQQPPTVPPSAPPGPGPLSPVNNTSPSVQHKQPVHERQTSRRPETSQEAPRPSPKPSLPQAQPKMVVGKRPPGRPPKSSRPSAADTPVTPPVKYSVFKCDWKNCVAELHNLETLKKHVGRTHIPHTLTCQWNGCKMTEAMPAAELLRHVKNIHIEPIAWKLGDGPSVPRTDDDAGRPAIPSAIPDQVAVGGEDSLIFPTSDSSIRAFNKVHGKHTQRDKAMEVLKAVQRAKEQVGFGLDPGGCQLATPARNERVNDEEGVYEVRSA
ncbi:hypothetical protein BDV59DRAFT_181953 [Aspergillus ambiguus]|uniref:putative C2H2 finger domain protein n=1 Tax=Aspergillus ambiguus TaxID=176160 RepID=UPI003CCE1AB7